LHAIITNYLKDNILLTLTFISEEPYVSVDLMSSALCLLSCLPYSKTWKQICFSEILDFLWTTRLYSRGYVVLVAIELKISILTLNPLYINISRLKCTQQWSLSPLSGQWACMGLISEVLAVHMQQWENLLWHEN
jgi:hypothetical protein